VSEIPDDAVVIRYGETMRTSDLAFAALKHSLRHGGVFALSVNTIPGLSPEETAAAGRRPNRRFCFTTAGAIRDAGFTFSDKIDDDGHTNVILPSPPSADDLAQFAACFTGTGDNPNPVPPSER